METKDQVYLTDKVVDAIVNDGPFLSLPLGEIGIAPRTTTKNEGTKFFNPRSVKGFEASAMGELEHSIAQDGVLQPPAVRRLEDGTYQLVAGERRTRAIRNLVARNEMVATDDGFKPASEVYRTVYCRLVTDCNDEKAIRLAFSENDQHVPLSEGDVLDLCERLEDLGYTQKAVGELLRKCPAWVCHTFSFRKHLSPELYEMLRAGRLSRSAAIKILEQPESLRDDLVSLAQKVATERFEGKKTEALIEVDEADKSLTAAKVALAEVVAAPDTSTKVVEGASKQLTRANRKVDKAVAALDDVEKTGVVYQAADVDEAVKQIGLKGGKGLSSKAIFRRYVEKAEALAEGGKYAARDLALVTVISRGIAQGEKDLEGLLDGFLKEHPVPKTTFTTSIRPADIPPVLLPNGIFEDAEDNEDDEDFEDIDGLDMEEEEPDEMLADLVADGF